MADTKQVCEGKRVVLLDRDGWEYVERRKGKEAVAIIAVTDDDRVLLTEQFRKPVSSPVIDLPAGLVGDEEGHDDPVETARKELEEEVGYTCSDLELLARGPSSPGITSEIVSLYRATGVSRKGQGGGVGGESIKVHAIPRKEVIGWLKKQSAAGRLIDLKIWSGMHFLGIRD